jgi:thiosulfate/3-mercaptopyruvate sulfurtransferase
VPLLPGPLVDAAWLQEHRGDVRLLDVRWYLDGRSGRAAYGGGHLPGAVWADVDADLSGPPTTGGGRHPLPEPAAFAAALERLGVSDGDAVVAYDDASGSIAARAWWMLRAVGVPAAVLDGGIQAWPGRLETAPVTPVPGRFTSRPWPAEQVRDTDAVDRLRYDPAALLLDARTAARFRGEPNAIDARAGHVPGARSAPWGGNVDGASGRLLAPERLRERYEALGAADAGLVVVSCGSGVTACHDLLALELAGLGPTALYPGSWSAWSADPSRPAATGDGD